MLKSKNLILITLLIVAAAGNIFAQDVVEMPRPKPTPKNVAELSDAEVQKQILQTFQSEDGDWREFVYPESQFKAVFPRTPVRQSLAFTDKALGNLRLTLFFGPGDNGVYCIGQMRLPYQIREQEPLRETYKGFLDGLAASGTFRIEKKTDIVFKGLPAVKVLGSYPNETPVELRVVVVGKNLFYTMVIGGGPGRLPDSPATISLADSERFLESFEVLPEEDAVSVTESPIFKSSVTDSVFSSDYFLFTLNVPKEWYFLEQSDVNDLRSLGSKSAATSVRRNLFAVTTKALGMERNSTLECNVVKSPGKATTMQLAAATRVQYLRMGRYKSVSKPVNESIGGIGFVRIDMTGETDGAPFTQKSYLAVRKGYVLIFILTAYDEKDVEPLVGAMKSIKFRAK